jgi:ABC-type polysaccharide/polyol phosphate transport system ATPase subunit
MSETAIVVENLGKKYSLLHENDPHQGLRHVIQSALLRPFQSRVARPKTTTEDFWALHDVSFSIAPGEVVGIIGRNGAGKSTLLKILSRITEPTRGRVRINGRVASLLEVGTGFHPELTGRENIYLNGTILGMTRREITRKFDEIVAFAEVEKFLDTPVKHYSSGMYVRLAFAVAAHLEPEILIVDEVLAVGDTQFQKKCLGKMQDVSQREGRTVLFVSHNMAAISTLTQRVILLRKGAVEYSGAPQEGINLYMTNDAKVDAVYSAKPHEKRPSVTHVEVACSESPQTHASGKPWSVTFRLHYPYAAPNACLLFQIFNQYQNPVLQFCANDSDLSLCRGVGDTEVRCEIPSLSLNVGSYYLKASFCEPPGGEHYENPDHICPFDVIIVGKTTRFGWRPDAADYLETARWSVQ